MKRQDSVPEEKLSRFDHSTLERCNLSAHARVALPLDFGHLACNDINIERTIAPDPASSLLDRNGVVTGSQGNPKPALVICDEGGHRPFVILNDEIGISQRP
jgi:hypothetical protein